MDALEALLRPLASILNRNIGESTPARELCRELDGAVIAVGVRDTSLTAYFIVAEELMSLVSTCDDDPDVVIEGTLISLARLAGQSREGAIRDGSLTLTGDAELANRFQALLDHAKPDLEEEIAGIIGDVAAHRLGEFARGIGRWGRDARSTMAGNIREYLQEESRDTPSRYEVERFSDDVGSLRDDVARIEARIDRLQRAD